MAIDYAALDAALDDELRAASTPAEEENDDGQNDDQSQELDSPEQGTESETQAHEQDLEESTLVSDEPQTNQEATVSESRYHSAVVAMNKAQQELAERRKQDAEKDSLIAQLQSQLQQITEENAKPPQEEAPTQELNLDGDTELAEAKELFPEVINPLLKVIAGLEKKLAAITDDVGNVKSVSERYQESERKSQETAQQNEVDKHISAIKEKHPDLDNLVKSDSYATWYYEQGPLIQQALQQGSTKDVISALNLYRAEHPSESVPNTNKTVKTDKLAAAKDAALPSIKTGQNPTQRKTFTNAEIAKMSTAEYAKHEAAIDAALLRGDIT